jgi:hypothetical protein
MHDLGVSADALRVGSLADPVLAVAELEDSVLILNADGTAGGTFLSVLAVKGFSSRAPWCPRLVVVDGREFLSVGHGHFRQHFWWMQASGVGEQKVL